MNSASSSQVSSSSVKPSSTVTLRSSSAANSSSATVKSSNAQSSSVAAQKSSLQNQISQKKQDLSNEQSQQSSLQNQYQKDSQMVQQNQRNVNSIKNSETQIESKVSSLNSQKSSIQNQINNSSEKSDVISAQQKVTNAQNKLNNDKKALSQAQQGVNNSQARDKYGHVFENVKATSEQEKEWDNGVNLDSQQQSMLDTINLYRMSHGLAPLKASEALNTLAAQREKVAESYGMWNFNHQGYTDNIQGHPYGDVKARLENFYGMKNSVSVVIGWLAEPNQGFDHRFALLDPEATEIGFNPSSDLYSIIETGTPEDIDNNMDYFSDSMNWNNNTSGIYSGIGAITPVPLSKDNPSTLTSSEISDIDSTVPSPDITVSNPEAEQKLQELQDVVNGDQNNLSQAEKELNDVKENNNQVRDLQNVLDGINKQLISAALDLQNTKDDYTKAQNKNRDFIGKLNKDKAALDKLNNQIAQTKQEINNLENQLSALNGQPTMDTPVASKPATAPSVNNGKKTDDVLPGPDQIVVTPTETKVSNKTAANLDYNHGIDPLTGKALKDETPAQQQKAKAYVDALNKDTNNATASSKQNTPVKNTESPVVSTTVKTTSSVSNGKKTDDVLPGPDQIVVTPEKSSVTNDKSSSSVAKKVVASISYNKGIDPLTNRLLGDETPAQRQKAKSYVESLNKTVAVKEENKSSKSVYNQPITFNENKVKADNVKGGSEVKNELPTTGENQDKAATALGIEAVPLGLALGGLSFLKRKKRY